MKLSLLIFVITPYVMLAQSSWSEKLYDQYNYKSFKNFRPSQQKIDFKNIDYPLLNAAVFYATNEEQMNNGINIAAHSPICERAAFGHSVDMVKKDFFSHTSRINGKKSVMDRMRKAGYQGGGCAENIAITFGIEYEANKPAFAPSQNGGYFSYEYRGDPIPNHTYLSLAKAVLTQWMNSPGHRANILTGYSFMGCGGFMEIQKDEDQWPQFRMTQNFATSKE